VSRGKEGKPERMSWGIGGVDGEVVRQREEEGDRGERARFHYQRGKGKPSERKMPTGGSHLSLLEERGLPFRDFSRVGRGPLAELG
jgi:hypothetical protein